MKKYSLRTKLTLSYVLVAIVSLFLISILTNLLLDKYFKDYIIRNQEINNKEIAAMLSQQYSENKWDLEAIENICIRALKQGMIIKLSDTGGKVIWDAKIYDNELCEEILNRMEQNMISRYPNWKGSYAEDIYPVVQQGNKVGTVAIGYYGPFYFNDSDLKFINTINIAITGIGVFILIMCLVIGSIMSRRLTTPVSRAITTAQMISKGYFDDRITEQSSTKETAQLIETINNLAETLENQENLRKRLTADVAHELRTPLATLQSHLEAMIDGIWKPDADRLKSCHDEIIRISRLVGDLEKLARFESENLVLNKTSFDVSKLVKTVIQNFENDFSSKNINVIFTGDEEIVTADKDKISQVFINLISNAIKYTPQGGKIEINVKGFDDTVYVLVKDNGYGISPEDIPYIFERFYRADKSRNRTTGGAGIGLTITRAIIKAHKGDIQVKSKINEGTEFTVILSKE